MRSGKLGGPDWFRLGNKDLAVHLERTRRLQSGELLSEITRDFCRGWGISATVLPMSDDSVSTIVQTNQGDLPFQDYFVKMNCTPEVAGFEFRGSSSCSPAGGVIQSIQDADLIVICPSNPWVSIDPILSVPGIREELMDKVVIGCVTDNWRQNCQRTGCKNVSGNGDNSFSSCSRRPLW